MKKTLEIHEKNLSNGIGKVIMECRLMMMSRRLNGVAFGWKCLIKSLITMFLLLEHSIQFLSSTTWKDVKGLKVENTGQSFQVLWTRWIPKIS